MIKSGKFTPGIALSFHAYCTVASVQRIFQVDKKRLISVGRGCFTGQTVRQFAHGTCQTHIHRRETHSK